MIVQTKKPSTSKRSVLPTTLVEIVVNLEKNRDFVRTLLDRIKGMGQRRVSLLINIEDIRGLGPLDLLFDRLRTICFLPATFNRCALIEDSCTIIRLARLADHQFPCVAIRGFSCDEMSDARRWVAMERRS